MWRGTSPSLKQAAKKRSFSVFSLIFPSFPFPAHSAPFSLLNIDVNRCQRAAPAAAVFVPPLCLSFFFFKHCRSGRRMLSIEPSSTATEKTIDSKVLLAYNCPLNGVFCGDVLVLVLVEMPLQCRCMPIDFINEWSALVSVSAVAVAVFAVTAVSFSVFLLLCVCVLCVWLCHVSFGSSNSAALATTSLMCQSMRRRGERKRESGVKHHQQYLCRQLSTLSFSFDSILLLLPLLCLVIVDLLCVCLSQTFECLCPECA